MRIQCIRENHFLILAFLLISLISSAPTLAQEETTNAEELFRWFPEGGYSWMYHLDKYNLERGKGFEGLKFVLGREGRIFPYEPLPPALQEKFDSRTVGQLARIRIAKFKEGDKVAGGDKPTGIGYIGGKSYTYTDVGEVLFVYRFTDLDALIAESLKAAEIVTTEQRLIERPVYSFSFKGEGAKSTNYYAYATDTQELLVAQRPELLQKMIAAGYGRELSMLDDQEYASLWELTPTLGQQWYMMNLRLKEEIQLEQMRKAGEPEGKIADLEEKMSTGNPMNLRDWHVDEKFSDRAIHIFGDEESAKKFYDWIQQRPKMSQTSEASKISRDYWQSREKNRKISVDGIYVYVITTYDGELLTRLQALREEDERQKKEEAEKEKQKQ